jgi:hypothetical protein
MWQTEFQLPTFGGMGESASIFWPKDYRKRLDDNFVKALRGAAMYPARRIPFMPADRERLDREGFRWIVLRLSLLDNELARQQEERGLVFDADVARADTVAALTAGIGSPPAGLDGDALLWDLRGTWVPQEAWKYTAERLSRREWQEDPMPQFELRLRSLGRTGTPPDRVLKTLPH